MDLQLSYRWRPLGFHWIYVWIMMCIIHTCTHLSKTKASRTQALQIQVEAPMTMPRSNTTHTTRWHARHTQRMQAPKKPSLKKEACRMQPSQIQVKAPMTSHTRIGFHWTSIDLGYIVQGVSLWISLNVMNLCSF